LGSGEIHAFFNNAGIEGPVAAAGTYPIEAFDQLFGVVLDPGGVSIERLDQATGALSGCGRRTTSSPSSGRT
jgi:hypothetical protein